MKRLRQWWANPAGLCASCGGSWNRHDEGVIHRDGSVSCTAALQVQINRTASAWYPIGGVAMEGGTYYIEGNLICRTNPVGQSAAIWVGSGTTTRGDGHLIGVAS